MGKANAGAVPQTVAGQQQPGTAVSPAQNAQPPTPQGQVSSGQVSPGAGDQANSGRIDLTSIPEFRQFQSEQDRKLAAIQRQLEEERAARSAAEARERQRDAERQAQELTQLSSLDPEERANRAMALLQQQQAQARRNEIVAEANAAAQAAGIGLNDPRLASALAIRPTEAGLLAVHRAINGILAEQARATQTTAAAALAFEREQAQAAAQVAAQRAGQQALTDAGMHVSSNAPSVVQAVDQSAAQITAFKQRFNSLRGTGTASDNPAVKQLISDLAEAGLTLGDLS